jgi:hypothetical protein
MEEPLTPAMLVFDEVVRGSALVYTDPKFDDVLGRGERTNMLATVQGVAGACASLSVRMQRSADGANWFDTSASPEIAAMVASDAITTHLGAASCPARSGDKARLAVSLTGARSSSARVKVFVRPEAEG